MRSGVAGEFSVSCGREDVSWLSLPHGVVADWTVVHREIFGLGWWGQGAIGWVTYFGALRGLSCLFPTRFSR